MHVAIAAIKAMFHNPSDAFWTGRAMDLIFDGIDIDCSSKDPLVRIACKEIDRNGGATIMRANETTFKFSMLGGVSVSCLASVSGDVSINSTERIRTIACIHGIH